MKNDLSKAPLLAALLVGAMAALSSASAGAQGVPQIRQSVDDSLRVVLKGNTPPQVNAQEDQGAVESSAPANHMLLVLKRSDAQEASLGKLIEDQHNPSSASFHKWLTPEEFGKKFGVEDSDVEAVKAWLQAKGFAINKVSAGKTVIDFSGTAGQVKGAFHTELHTYLHNGVAFHANNKDPEIPAALAPVVQGIASLNDIKPRSFSVSKGRVSFDPETHLGTPLWNDPLCGANPAPGSICTEYVPTPADIATQYGITSVYKSGYSGAGVTIGIVGDSNVDMSNVQNYRKFFKIADANNLPQEIVDGEDPGQNGDAGESYLDVEVSGAIAPAAKINLYVSADTLTTSGLSTALVRAVEDDVADVISLSYGLCEKTIGASGNQFFYYGWQQAAAQGQSVFVAAGDSGSAGCDSAHNAAPAYLGLAVSGFASTPYNVAVGGTDFYYSDYKSGYGSSALNAQLAKYWGTATTGKPAASILEPIPEQPWNDYVGLDVLFPTGYSIAAGSGGPSTCVTGVSDPDTGGYDTCTAGYPKPSWQKGKGVPADGVRDIPDVSLFAADGANMSLWPICVQAEDCTNYTTDGGSVGVTGVGGTSASSPAMAAIMALVDQSQKGRQGNPNFVFYALAAQYPTAFNDVTVGSNNVICTPGTSHCSKDKNGDGLHTLQEYPATANYDLASGLGSVNVANLIANWSKVKSTATTTTLGLSSTAITHGTPITAKVSVSSGSGTPTGTVALVTTSSSPAQAGQGTIALTDGTGTSPLYLPGGSYNVTADYSGDGKFGASSSSPVAVTVLREASTATLTASAAVPNMEAGFQPTPITNGSTFPYGYTLSFDAAVAGQSGQGIPTGTVTFTQYNTPVRPTNLGVANLNAYGVAEFQTFTLGAGYYSIGASYQGDASFKASSPSFVSFTISKGNAYVFPEDASQDGPIYKGQTFSVPFLIAGSNGRAPSGDVTVTFGSRTVSVPITATVAEGQPMGTGTANFTDVQAGTYTMTINYAGDKNYLPTSSYPETVTVVAPTLLKSTTTVSSSTLSAGSNGTFTLTATVTGNGKIAPTGGILFYLNGTPENFNLIPLKNGKAEITLTNFNLFTGKNTAAAEYMGDSKYDASISPQISIQGNEGDFSFTVGNPNLEISSGSSVGTPLVFSSIEGLGGTMSVTCTPSSPSIGCKLTPATFTLNPLGQQSVVTALVQADSANGKAKPGNYSVAITAADGGVLHTLTLNVTVK
jgi:subtilase family serine protease